MKIIGPYTSPTIYSENPGTVELVSSDPSVAIVDASVVIPGTRAWRNGLKHGQYLARANCLQARDNCAWFLEIQTKDLDAYNGVTGNALSVSYIVSSFGAEVADRINWAIGCYNLKTAATTRFFSFILSASQSGAHASAVTYNAAMSQQVVGNETKRLILTFTGTTFEFYTTSGTTPIYTGTRTLTGTMGGSEYTVIQVPCKFGKMEGALPSQAQREAFISTGTLPAGLAASYQGGHEIDPTAPVFWDTAGTNDLTKTDVQYWPPAAASGDYTDDSGDPVVPFQPFTITPISTGTFTITARRRRQGVPDRASDGEKYETTSETFTITALPDEVTQYVRLMITTSAPGTVVIASSDPAVVTFPASVVVGPTLQYEVLGTVVGAGTSTVTTTMDGTLLDTTTVTIEAEPTVVKCGPSQDIRSRI